MRFHELPNTTVWPSHWRDVPLWSIFDRVKDVGHPEEDMLSVYRAHGVVMKSARADNFNKTAENRNIYQLIDDGWLVVNRMKAWQGSVGISSLKGIVSGHYLCFRPNHSEDSGYLNWLFRSQIYATEYGRMSRGVRPSQIEIDNDELRSLRVALPPLEEQRRITDFLDEMVAQIDQICDGRKAQREILEEFCRSIIDSHIDNLMPARSIRLGYLASIQSGITVDANRKAPEGSKTYPYLRVANVQTGYVDLTELSTIEIPRTLAMSSRLRNGDVLMTEGGDLDKLGRGTVWRGEVANCLHQNHVFAVRPRQDLIVPDYLAMLTASSFARTYFESTGNKTTNLASTSSSKIRDFRIPVPDLNIQRTTFENVEAAQSYVHQLARELDRQLVVLAERRQSLITAAVTGQLDVTTARPSFS